jgi:hypothetical protein
VCTSSNLAGSAPLKVQLERGATTAGRHQTATHGSGRAAAPAAGDRGRGGARAEPPERGGWGATEGGGVARRRGKGLGSAWLPIYGTYVGDPPFGLVSLYLSVGHLPRSAGNSSGRLRLQVIANDGHRRVGRRYAILRACGSGRRRGFGGALPIPQPSRNQDVPGTDDDSSEPRLRLIRIRSARHG